MSERTIKARDLAVGDVFVDYEEEEFAGPDGARVTSISKGNGIVRFASTTGSGYFYEDADVVVR